MPKVRIEYTQATDVSKFVQTFHMNTDMTNEAIEEFVQTLKTQGVLIVPLEIELNINGLLKGLSVAKVDVSFLK
ncbi:TPA: hypothetical protein ACGVB5_004928 [Vibrio vulnificus]|nr:hypothetical protein [Vibrio vulnificus]HAS6037124.1 hypothetical protein [Vibrio vulnificus]HAT8553919.1 hypothetical protein [Vibrio vulnificus]HDY8021435.1 hypothetical protein [Vibrio vulnificus]